VFVSGISVWYLREISRLLVAATLADYLITEMEREDIEPEEYDESTLLTPDVRDMMELEVCFVVVLSLLIVYNFKEFFECRIFMLLSAIP